MAAARELLGLVDGTALRTLALAVRRDVDQFDPPETADPALLAVAEAPFESVADVTDRLDALETQLREQGDRRAVFLTIYVRMTRAVREGIERGTFADPAWMRRYLVTFADYYRRAFLAFERGRLADVPAPWRVAFGTALRGDALVVQDAVLGVNAHINYDLAHALAEVGIDPDRGAKYDDHLSIDAILARLVDAQQEALATVYDSRVDAVDALFGRLDESLMLRSMTEGREQAWRAAVVLTDLDVPPVGAWTRWVVRATATGGAFFVRELDVDPAVRRSLRERELGDFDLASVLDRVAAHMDETG